MGRTDAASLAIAASPSAVFRAFATPEALMAWLPPDGMTGRALAYEFRPGGSYRLELAYAAEAAGAVGKTTARTDVSAGRFLAIEPDARIAQTVVFEGDDPAFAGEMVMTWRFAAAGEHTLVTVTAEDVPPGISAEDHATGLRASLANLARYVQG